MEKSKKIQLLSEVSMFASLPKNDLEEISDFVTHRIIEKGTAFIEEGAEGHEAYVILSGVIKVYRLTPEGKEVYLALRVPGETTGEFALLDDLPRSAYCKTLHKTEVLVIPKKEFVGMIRKSPNVAMEVIKMLAKRLRENVALTQDNETKKLRERMLSLLQHVAKFFPDKEITITHEELSDIVGATRPRVTEALHELVNDEKIRLSHKKIIVLPIVPQRTE